MKHLIANQIRIFLAIVEEGSITAAADRLSMGKSAVSDALKQLELSLSVQLLIRTTRRQRLTTIGEQFYRRCRELSDLSNFALEELNQHLGEPAGRLRITAPHVLVEHCLGPALGALITEHPRIEPELVIDDKRLDLIEQNIDLAFSIGDLPDSEFKAQRVGTLKDILCTSPNFFKQQGLDASKEQQNLPYIANSWEGSNISHTLSCLKDGENHTFEFRRIASASSVAAVFTLVEQGLGVGNLPHVFIKDKLASGELVELLPDFTPRSTGIYAVHPYGKTPPLSVRAIIDKVRSLLAS